ncbi:hypothetical protein D3OALGA1CA_2961 [Olavius algarvensis associated proteobacterium Delta 3]|nr:hypothetical protein D3OALGB2SA_742 [Olavius algarvensis associated proteobacterium Delta 3]CAB5126861.1 hypothetical protein D3OALGA1CA_2961 [Olavius algarvensis associated proteobacterium Delta 3]
MKDVTDIVDEYRNSDFERRLSLFLCHRSLRDEFMSIDQEESRKPEICNESTSWLGKPVHRPFRRLVNWCCGAIV